MALAVGDKLGPCEILSPIGAGGMGEVYRAPDSRIGRDMAIKISSLQFSERFAREARAVAALNHPNSCTLHDVGANFLVMELVDGEPPHGPRPLDTAMNYARQIADALDAAHGNRLGGGQVADLEWRRRRSQLVAKRPRTAEPLGRHGHVGRLQDGRRQLYFRQTSGQ
jgi:serine/threonine protein kinase